MAAFEQRSTGSTRRLAVLFGLLVLSGCHSSQLPNDVELTISPTSRSVEIVQQVNAQNQCLFNPNNYQDVPLLFSLADGQGSPIGNADVGVYVDFSENTFSGLPVLALYEDRNSNGVIDGEAELVSGINDPAFTMKTAQYSGEHLMLLRINLSCPYRGEVFAYAKSTSAMMSVEVNALETITVSTVSP